jgi:hypothetical protein
MASINLSAARPPGHPLNLGLDLTWRVPSLSRCASRPASSDKVALNIGRRNVGPFGNPFGVSQAWWIPTAKAKAIPGLVLGLRFAHVLGRIHGCLTTKSVLLDSNHRIQIADFLSRLSGDGFSGFSSERWNPERDIRGFVPILFEIIVGRPAKDEADIPAPVPMFVCEMIKSGLSGEYGRLPWFCDIFETLKRHDFGIVSEANSAEVFSSVSCVEELEHFQSQVRELNFWMICQSRSRSGRPF